MRISYVFIILILTFCFTLGFFVNILNNYPIDFSILEYKSGKPSILLDDEGHEWARFELDRREFIKFNKIPKNLINAFIAAEDRNFFQHSGLSLKGILRSIIVNIRYGRKAQGASTITQQLVRLLFFDSKKTFTRKIKEQFFSLLVERQFSKEQILETYLNHVYFGCGIYGVEAASQRFFGKSVQDINSGEAALLAGVVKSPANFCPLLCPLSAQQRRDLILGIMEKLKFITKEESKELIKHELKLRVHENRKFALHLKETIRLFCEDKFGKKNLYCAGLTIQTTINRKIQETAQEEFSEQFMKLKEELVKNIDGALICMDGKSGEIKALIGGVDFAGSKFNRALQAKRQIGSIFKPIVYAAALQKGMSFVDTEIDEPIEVNIGNKKWCPQNNTCKFDGKMTLAKALSYSNNIIAIKTLLKIGFKDVIKLADKLRFSANLNPYPAMALGCLDATLKEAVGAFNVFANNGTYVEPYFLKWIKDEFGTKIWKFEPEREQIMSSIVSGQVAKVLSIGIQRYLNRLGNTTFKSQAIGKTGTTNNSRTCWFSGSTPNLTTSIYVGCDDNQSMGNDIYAVRTAFPIWLNLHLKLESGKSSFVYDSALKEISINWNTGQISNDLLNPDVVQILVPR